MKFLLLATFLVFCAASVVDNAKKIFVDDDGSTAITSSFGNRVVITKAIGYDGQKAIDITIAGPNIPTKRIQINEDNNLYDRGNRYPWSSVHRIEEDQLGGTGNLKAEKSQADILFEILRKYQGPVSGPLFEELLQKIDTTVRKGEISPQIYDSLVKLDQIDNPFNEVNQVGASGQSTVPGRYVSWYTRVIPQIQGQIPLVQGGLYGQNWGITRYINPLLERWLQAQQFRGRVNSGFPTQENTVDQILRFNSRISGGVQTQQNIVDDILAQQQSNGGVPVSFQTQQNIVGEILARQQLNGGVPVSFQTQQNIVNGMLAGQQLTGTVPLAFQTQPKIVNGILARQQSIGRVPLTFQTQQNIADEILARQQLNNGVSSGLQTNQNIVSGLLRTQQLNRGISRDYQSRQDILDEILAGQELRGGVTRGYQTDQNVINEFVGRQQGSTQNIMQDVLEQQRLNNDIVGALQSEHVANDFLIQQQQQQLQQLQQQQQQFDGVSSGWQNEQNIVKLLKRQQSNSGVESNVGSSSAIFGRNDEILKEYLRGNRQVPYSQRQSFGALLGMLTKSPVRYYNQGLKEGYRTIQGQPTIVQSPRGVYMDNMGVPQVAY